MSKQEQASRNSICRPTSAEKDWSVSNYLPPAISPDYHQADIVSAYIVEDNEEQHEYSNFGDERNILELETKKHADEVFGKDTKIFPEAIRKLLRIRVSPSKTMTLEQRLAAGNKVITRLKTSLAELSKGKDEFVQNAIQTEKSLRQDFERVDSRLKVLEQDYNRATLEVQLEKRTNEMLLEEIKDLKSKLNKAEEEATILLVKLKVEEKMNRI